MSPLICKVDDCGRIATYKSQQVCQKHYFRFMRNGHYGLKDHRKEGTPRARKYRYTEKTRGYCSVYEPGHPLSSADGMVREHRFVYYENVDKNPTSCEICKRAIHWKNLHIDHMDNNPSNNSPENLRALCRGCNVYRDRPLTSGCKYIFTINGVSMSAHAWASREDVFVAGVTIVRRRLKYGWDDEKCVYAPRVTHHSTTTKVPERKYLSMRMNQIKELKNG